MTERLWLPAAADRFTPGRDVDVTAIVYHTTTTTFAGAITIFQGGPRKVSAHYVVDKTRDRIAQCVNEEDTAWHAGNWPVNQRSIGIEGVDDGDWWGPRPDDFYDREIELSLEIMSRHPISEWLRHDQTTATACPDGLDTGRIISALGGPQEVPSQAQWDQHLADEAATANAIKELLNPIAAWVYDAPNRKLSVKSRNDFRKAMRILDEASRPPKKAKPASRAQVMAGHGKG